MSERRDEKEEGRFAYEGLDRVMHEKARLGIMTSLATHQEGLLFNELKELCSLTDGNLSRHIQVLQEAGLIEVWKRFQDRRPQTLCRLSPEGRKRFISYLEEMERVLKDAYSAQANEAKKKSARFLKNPDIQGWTPA
ncbi:transcriptional regulator [Candidatus Sumerlaeota bacterium]|nr:transcriptional regulator [Candidatus Sumerlaeota bacterium]